MTESTGVKEEMHCHSGFFSYFLSHKTARCLELVMDSPPEPLPGPFPGPAAGEGAYSAAPAESGNDLQSLRFLPSASWELLSSAKGVTSETQGVTRYLDKF